MRKEADKISKLYDTYKQNHGELPYKAFLYQYIEKQKVYGHKQVSSDCA